MDVSELKQLWKEVFGDSDEYLHTFFEKVYREENTLVHTENGKIVSALYMIPYKMIIDGKMQDIIYLYALATDYKHRGRGIMSTLIEEAHKIGTDRGYTLSVLIPAEKSLFDYYRKFGYETCVRFTKTSMTIEEMKLTFGSRDCNCVVNAESDSFELHKANATEIWEAYFHSNYNQRDGIRLSQEQNEFYVNELVNEGGECVTFPMKDGSKGYALLKLVDKTLTIYESNVDSDHIREFCRTLIEKYAFDKIVWNHPTWDNLKRGHLFDEYAMLKKLKNIQITEIPDNKELYINRVLM